MTILYELLNMREMFHDRIPAMHTAMEKAMETVQHRLRQPADGRRRRRLIPAMQMPAAVTAAGDGRRCLRLILAMQMTVAAIKPPPPPPPPRAQHRRRMIPAMQMTAGQRPRSIEPLLPLPPPPPRAPHQ